MAGALVGLIMLAFALIGTGLFAQTSFRSWTTLSDSWKQMQVRTSAIERSALAMETTALPRSTTLSVTLKNTGQVNLVNYQDWDLFVQYYDSSGVYYQQRLAYVSSGPPGGGQWTVSGIYLDAAKGTTEAFQPGILNPGEEIVLTATLSPGVGKGTTNEVTVTNEYGTTASGTF